MKRAIALLMSAMFCVMAGIEFILPKDDNFTLNTDSEKSYFSPTGTELSAADLYRLQYGVDDDREPCDTAYFIPKCTTFTATGQPPYYIVYKKPATDGEAYVPVTSSGDTIGFEYTAFDGSRGVPVLKPTTDANRDTLDLTKDFYIVAPVEGHIKTSHFACDYGHTMDYEFDYNSKHWKMSITNAKCWFCCRDKTEPESGMYTATTTDSMLDRFMYGGNLLCIGGPNTKISISEISSPISTP